MNLHALVRKIFYREVVNISAESMLLTVLYVTARHGFSFADAMMIRKLVIDATPFDFEFVNPVAFCIFFKGAEKGNSKAAKLEKILKEYADKNFIHAFGIGMKSGNCIVDVDKNGVAMRPSGIVINDAMKAAIHDANSD